jgi:hypothetical protein
MCVDRRTQAIDVVLKATGSFEESRSLPEGKGSDRVQLLTAGRRDMMDRRQREQREQIKMREEDVNVAVGAKRRRVRVNEEASQDWLQAVADSENELQMATSEQLQQNETPEGNDFVTELFRNLLALQDKLQSFDGGMQLHTRREEFSGFFMPLVFSGDIRFAVFESPSSVDWPHDEVMDSDEGGLTGFADIESRIARKAADAEAERLTQRSRIYSEEDLLNWTPIEIHQVMDWKAFFENQKPKPLLPIEEIPTEEELFRELIAEEVSRSRPSTRQITDDLSMSSQVPYSLFSNLLTEDIDITPLPFGHVEKRLVLPSQSIYFQLELPGAFSLLTIEVFCEMGGAAIYVSHTTPPTISLHDYHAHCPEHSPSGSKVIRITIPLADNRFQPLTDPTTPYFILVLGDPSGASCSVWASASLPLASNDGVEKKVSGIQLLSDCSVKSLLTDFGSLRLEAEEEADRMHSPTLRNSRINSEVEELLGNEMTFSAVACTTVPRSSDDDSEDEEVGEFLSRSGRAIIKRESSSRGLTVDPNFNRDLFSRPVLRSRQEVYSTFAPVRRANDDDEGDLDSAVVTTMFSSLKQLQAYRALGKEQDKEMGTGGSGKDKLPAIANTGKTGSIKLGSSSSFKIKGFHTGPLLPIKYTLTGGLGRKQTS